MTRATAKDLLLVLLLALACVWLILRIFGLGTI